MTNPNVFAQQPRIWAQHPATYLPAGIFGVVVAIFGITQLFALFQGNPWFIINLILLVVSALIVWGCAVRVLSGLLTTWWLDDHKLNERYEGLARSNDELHYHRIAEVALYQGLFGRIFGYGTLQLTLQGRDGKWTIPNAPNPHALRDYFSVIASQNSRHKP